MAFDERLATRVRAALAAHNGVDEQHMFGGVAFLLHGRMLCGVHGNALVLRLGRAGSAEALLRPHVRPMDLTGKVLGTMVFVDPPGCRNAAQLRSWLERALRFHAELEASPTARRRRGRTASRVGASIRRPRG
jgi:TfoX/Sxy family transcriptional regulator of competence genes